MDNIWIVEITCAFLDSTERQLLEEAGTEFSQQRLVWEQASWKSVIENSRLISLLINNS